jgi:polysaccharide export outer membrane protein
MVTVMATTRRGVARLACQFVLLTSIALSVAAGQDFPFTARKDAEVISTEEIVKRFEAPELVTYTLGNGDELTVDVWNHPELSGKHLIGPDGKITLPVVGVVAVAGLSREDAVNKISSAFSRSYTDLAVTLRVDHYTSYRVFILGRVGNPGVLQFDSQPTLLDVLARAVTLPVGGVGVDKTALGRCAIIRGRDQMIWVDLKALLSQGNLGLNIRLARNDMVYIPDAGEQLIYVLGEVKHPGVVRLTPTLTFLDAFTQAGGLSEDAAENKIELVHSGSGEQIEFRLKDLLANPQWFNFKLQEGDIIYAPRRAMAKFGYVLQKTNSLAGFAVLATVGVK